MLLHAHSKLCRGQGQYGAWGRLRFAKHLVSTWASYLGSTTTSFHLLSRALRLLYPAPLREWSFSISFFLPGPDVTGGLKNAMSLVLSRLTMITLPLFAFLLSHNVRAQQSFFPPAIPLAVRSPYLNCWLQTGTPPVFGATWPTSFNVSQVCHPCTVY